MPRVVTAGVPSRTHAPAHEVEAHVDAQADANEATDTDDAESLELPAAASPRGPAPPITRVLANPRRDWHKPQFIDFSSPLLTGLFARLAGPAKHLRLVVEEEYPVPDDAPGTTDRAGDDTHVTEVVLQWRRAPQDIAQ